MRRRRAIHQLEIRRTLACAGSIFAVLLILAAVLFVAVPFRVNLRAEYSQLQGELRIADVYNNSLPLEAEIDRPIEPGETITVEAGSRVRIEIVEGSRAYAFVTGPAEWTLESAWRRATSLNHVLNNGEEYRIVISQNYGTVIYDFTRADPPPDELNVTIRFPDGEQKPELACFQADAGTPTILTEISCETSDESTPAPSPTSQP